MFSFREKAYLCRAINEKDKKSQYMVNKFAEYYKLQENYRLDQTGKWIKLDTSVIGEEDPIEMNFTEENGIMTGLNFSIHVQDGRISPAPHR